jgi:putative hydrolase of HD superfamily
MYRMGIITMLCPPELDINRDRCVKMALIHDMAEALVGDITPPDNVAKGVFSKFSLFQKKPPHQLIL